MFSDNHKTAGVAYPQGFTAAGVRPEELRHTPFTPTVDFLIGETCALLMLLREIRGGLPEFGLLPGAESLFAGLDTLYERERLAAAIAGADRFLCPAR